MCSFHCTVRECDSQVEGAGGRSLLSFILYCGLPVVTNRGGIEKKAGVRFYSTLQYWTKAETEAREERQGQSERVASQKPAGQLYQTTIS